MALPELAGWSTESVRATFIAHAPIAANGKGWWQALTGAAPEAVVTKPNAGEHSESGPFGAGRLEMKVTFNRIDWLYTPVMEPGPTVPSLGEARELMASLNGPLAAWLTSDDFSFVRIAYAPALLRPVSDVVEGNRTVLAYLPFVKANAELARDLFFQTNFPRQSAAVSGLSINRISKLMSAAAQLINIGNGGPVPTILTQFFCRAELDFSTSVDRTEPIPAASYSTVYEELVASAMELITVGVQP